MRSPRLALLAEALEQPRLIPDALALTIPDRVARTRQRIVASDRHADDAVAGLVRGSGVRVVACHPLTSGDRLLGTLAFASRSRPHFEEDELQFMRLIAHSVAVAMERAQVEEALRRRSVQFETLLNRAPLGVYLVDADFRIREVNPIALPVFGNVPGGVIGRDFDEVIHRLWEPRYADEVVRIFRHTLATGESYVTPERAELRIDRGLTEYYEWRLDRIPLPDGRHGVVCYFRDISAQVQARLAIAESEARFRAIAESLEEADRRTSFSRCSATSRAVKFTPAGGAVTVRVTHDAADAVLEVRDDGIGIPPELTGRVFDLFVQGERAADRAQGGLGIGLTLVRRLVERHGGTATAGSAGPGRGSTFTVRLPAIAPPALPVEPATECEPRTPRRILLIEDNADAREMLRFALERRGHAVIEAATGHEGIDMAITVAPDVALVDIGLPGLDGYEVARRVRAADGGRRIYLVAVTGYGQAEDRQRALAAGFDGHLVKPVGPQKLAAVGDAAPGATSASRRSGP